jgi:acyl dehydratase
VNPELQGREFPPTESYLVGREKVREFASAVFSTSPLNFDPDVAVKAGYPDVVAPPTFAVVVQTPVSTSPASSTATNGSATRDRLSRATSSRQR